MDEYRDPYSADTIDPADGDGNSAWDERHNNRNHHKRALLPPDHRFHLRTEFFKKELL
jgi:hypothetical protein